VTHVDAGGALWAGTQAGLNRLEHRDGERARFRRYGVADGLPDQTIDALASDARGTLWVGTNRGIASRDGERFRAYTPSDGVPDSSVNWRAAFAARDGTVYFGTTTGLVRVFPDRLRLIEPPPLRLSGYEIAGATRINLAGDAVPALETGYAEARVRFQVAAFGDHRRLSFRMVPLEPQWRAMPASLSIGYDPVPPGRYRFEVRRMGADGVWHAPALAIPLQVRPPPWRTGPAYASYAAALGAAALALVVAWRRRRSAQKRHVAELVRLATFDTLTGLPNRTRFADELAAAMRAETPTPLALLFIDLDRFKNINDSLGHGFGDLVLVAAAERLRAALPPGARLARLGGDEFTVVLPHLHNDRDAATVAQQLISAFASPLRVEGSDVVVTLSIGIGLFPGHARDPTTLTQYADSAMYYAKSGGRNAYRFFQPEMVAQVSRRLALETSLRHALERRELSVVFQPLIDLATGRVRGAEALLRWNSADHGAIAPAEFVPILEDTGLIEPVGLWVMERVCTQLRAWQQMGLPLLRVAVNVSVHQLIRGDLCEELAQLLTTLAIPRHALELEVTESAVMENAERMGAALDELRSLGLGLAIDDFGTGYSSFASLSHLPVDKLKIDKVFVDGVGTSDSADTLCAAIIAMAHNLRLTVVAEGVETELQHRRLLAMGCDEAQGYWYCRPVPLDEFEALVRTRLDTPLEALQAGRH
jgi:diguanylate cyclase (GGDEF)-like protein